MADDPTPPIPERPIWDGENQCWLPYGRDLEDFLMGVRVRVSALDRLVTKYRDQKDLVDMGQADILPEGITFITADLYMQLLVYRQQLRTTYNAAWDTKVVQDLPEPPDFLDGLETGDTQWALNTL